MSRGRHSFGPPDRHAIERCALCGVRRRIVYPLHGSIGAQTMLYSDDRRGAFSGWSDWNPGCVESWKRSVRLELVDARRSNT